MRCALAVLLIAMTAGGCAPKKTVSATDPMLELAKEPLSPDETKEVLAEAGSNWLYSSGIGSTVVDVGGIMIFPPYAAVIAGNSILGLAGYEGLRIRSVLPQDSQEDYDIILEQFTSGPGRLAAAIADEEFRSGDEVRERWRRKVSEMKARRGVADPPQPSFFEEYR